VATVSHDCVELFQWAGEHAGDRAFLLCPGMCLRGFGFGTVPDFPAVQQDIIMRAAVLVACFYRAASFQTVLEGCDECCGRHEGLFMFGCSEWHASGLAQRGGGKRVVEWAGLGEDGVKING
jgi:hypothetical protein